MKTALFDYPLPARLIAQRPADRRDASRLLVVHRMDRRVEHRHFRDLPEYVRTGDRLFRNRAAVIPARLRAARPTGGQVECLLLRPATDESGPARTDAGDWWCLLKPGRKLGPGATFGRPGFFTATVRETAGDGTARVAFATTAGNGVLAVADEIGEMPLPPYIAARVDDAGRTLDRERYQTVYADRDQTVAAAAPTAGLHFTPALLANVATKGVEFFDLVLHVGLGTFRPISSENIEEHAIHREIYEIPAATRTALVDAPGRRIAVGTTCVRAIEDFLSRGDGSTVRNAHDAPGPPGGFRGEAGLFIRPPFGFRGVDALITNFHQPRSTLLCLVAAFLTPGRDDGIAWLREIYAGAVDREYRFFSYGDAMLIL